MVTGLTADAHRISSMLTLGCLNIGLHKHKPNVYLDYSTKVLCIVETETIVSGGNRQRVDDYAFYQRMRPANRLDTACAVAGKRLSSIFNDTEVSR